MRLSFIQGVLVMETKLVPIYALRMMFLEKINPLFFAQNADLIRRTSLAAQDYFMSGTYKEYDDRSGRMFRTQPGYIAIHQKYNLPYSTTINPSTAVLNPGLVMDLTWALKTDITNNIVHPNGDIDSINKLPESEVLQVYHNARQYGIPINAMYMLMPSQIEKMMADARTKTR